MEQSPPNGDRLQKRAKVTEDFARSNYTWRVGPDCLGFVPGRAAGTKL